MEYIASLPTVHLIVLCIFILIAGGLLVGIFAPEIMRFASERMSKSKTTDDENSDKLDIIKELLESKIDNLEKRQDKIETSIEKLVEKIDQGFRSVHARLDDHLNNHQAIQSEYKGAERRSRGY